MLQLSALNTGLAIIVAFVAITEASLSQFVSEKEAIIRALATKAEAAHNARCTKLASCGTTTASGCSIAACGSVFPAEESFQCATNFGSDMDTCDGKIGLRRSFNTSAVRVPLDASFSNHELQAFTCASADLDSEFKAQNHSAWQYMGSFTGGSRVYPGAPQKRTSTTCSDYDPRLRPWYTAAASGPKDLVLVLDTSGSMSVRDRSSTRLSLMQQAVNSLLETTTENDFVQIVRFASNAASYKTHLMRMSNANRTLLQTYVNTFVASGLTRMELGLQTAFHILSRSSAAAGTSSGCNRIVLFLTDGQATSPSLVLPAVRNGQNLLGSNKAMMFTYSMTTAADDVLPKLIACEFSGVWARIRDGEDPLKEMAQYYQFVAAGMDSTTVRWSTPYIDAFGLGEMVTGALPVYDHSRGLPILIGVVGIDVTTRELEAESSGEAVEHFAYLAQRGSTCLRFNLSACQQQFLRSPTGYTCPSPATSLSLCRTQNEIYEIGSCTAVAGGLNSVLCDPIDQTTKLSVNNSKDYKDLVCCNVSKCATLGAVSLSYEPPAECFATDPLVMVCNQSWTTCRESAGVGCDALAACDRVRATCLELASNGTTTNATSCDSWAESLKSAVLNVRVGGEYNGSALQTACFKSGCASVANNCSFNESRSCVAPIGSLVQYQIAISGGSPGFTANMVFGTTAHKAAVMTAVSAGLSAIVGVPVTQIQVLKHHVTYGTLVVVFVVIPGGGRAESLPSAETVQERLFSEITANTSAFSALANLIPAVAPLLQSLMVTNLPAGATPVPAPCEECKITAPPNTPNTSPTFTPISTTTSSASQAYAMVSALVAVVLISYIVEL